MPLPTKLTPKLIKTQEEAVASISKLQTSEDAAQFLEIPLGQLLYLLYKLPDEKKFRSFDVPKKSGGHRSISAPIGGIAILLAKLNPVLQELYKTKSCVHGFVSGKSILSNAVEHKKKKYVLNIDIENFYGAINFGRVRGLFMSRPFNMGSQAATIFAHLCTARNSLPQGFPTSPTLSNFIAADLDKKLTLLAQRYGLTYTRYADDLTFSTSKKDFPRSVAFFEGNNPITGDVVLGKILEDEVHAAGFLINPKKTRLQIQGVRQEVTGLTVNEFPNVRRKLVRKTRAMIHAAKTHGWHAAESEYLSKYCRKAMQHNLKSKGEYFKSVIYGNLAFLKMVRGKEDEIYLRFCLQMAEIDSSPPESIKEIKKMYQKFEIFISHASEDKQDVAEPIFQACEKEGVVAFLDQKYIKWGDSLTEKINHALGVSKFVLAVISENSIHKTWPAKEVNAALARELAGKQKILPLIVGNPDISSLSLLSDKLYLTWDGDAEKVAKLIADRLKADG